MFPKSEHHLSHNKSLALGWLIFIRGIVIPVKGIMVRHCIQGLLLNQRIEWKVNLICWRLNAHVSSRKLQNCPPTIYDTWKSRAMRQIVPQNYWWSKDLENVRVFSVQDPQGFWSTPLKMIAPSGKLPFLKLATSIAPENEWLEDEISFQDGIFSRAMLVSGSVTWDCKVQDLYS